MKRYIKSSSFSGRVSAKQIADELYLLGQTPARSADDGAAYSEYCDNLEHAVKWGELELQSTNGRLVVFDHSQLGVIALGATEDRAVGVTRSYQGYSHQRYSYTVHFQNIRAYSWTTSTKETALQWARSYLRGQIDDQIHHFD